MFRGFEVPCRLTIWLKMNIGWLTMIEYNWIANMSTSHVWRPCSKMLEWMLQYDRFIGTWKGATMINLVSSLQRNLSVGVVLPCSVPRFSAQTIWSSDLALAALDKNDRLTMLCLCFKSSSTCPVWASLGHFGGALHFRRENPTDFRLHRFHGAWAPKVSKVGFTKKGTLPLHPTCQHSATAPGVFCTNGPPSGSLRGAGGKGHFCGCGWGALEQFLNLPGEFPCEFSRKHGENVTNTSENTALIGVWRWINNE